MDRVYGGGEQLFSQVQLAGKNVSGMKVVPV